MKVFVLEGVDEGAFLRNKIKEKTEKNVNKTKPSCIKKIQTGISGPFIYISIIILFLR